MSSGANRAPDEWRRTARECEAELDAYPQDRMEILAEAAHAWQRAGHLDEAQRCHERSLIEEPDPHMPDARVPYAEFLIETGQDPERGYALLRQLWQERPSEPLDYSHAAEFHEHRGALQEALTWCNAGLARCYPQPFAPEHDDLLDDAGLFMLLDARRRVRGELEQPADELDELVEAGRGEFAESLAPQAQPDTPPLVPYWPANEFDEARRRWPETLSDSGAEAPGTHTDYRRAVQRELRASAEGQTPLVVPVDAEQFDTFCRQRAAAGDVLTLLERYVLMREEAGCGMPWPPERNAACWCGSQRKYKKCCGAPGFADAGPERAGG